MKYYCIKVKTESHVMFRFPKSSLTMHVLYILFRLAIQAG
jgi:hypothetical protein